MKKLATHLLPLVLLALPVLSLQAQESEAPKQVRVVINKNINGVETAIDTTITLAPGQSSEDALLIMGMDEPTQGTEILRIRKQDLGGTSIKMDSDVNVNVEKNDDGSRRIIIVRDGEAQVIESAAAGTWTTDDGGTIDIQGMEGMNFIGEDGRVQVIKLGGEAGATDNVEVNVTGEGDQRRVVIRRNGEEHEIELPEGVEWNAEGENTFIRSLDSDVKVIEFRTDDAIENANGVVMKDFRYVKIVIKMEEPAAEELEMLQQSGDANSLQVGEMGLYPNPTTGRVMLNFQSAEEGEMNIEVRDLQGRSVYQQSEADFRGAYTNDIDLSSESAGVYFLTVTINGKSVTKKIVME
ncbi:MAG: T9SS type A sorting domain-containing protein [Bacteroidia bacterium]|nr:T9SS type A sorting domain-containing protein [Bacteroidia bacterium]